MLMLDWRLQMMIDDALPSACRSGGRAPFARAVRVGQALRRVMFSTLLSPLLETPTAVVETAVRIFERSRLGAGDAFLAATVMENAAEVLVSADRAFASICGPRHVLNGTRQFERLFDA